MEAGGGLKAKASVIIRTLNEERYIRRTLEAVFRQGADGFKPEVTIVDSGSTDGTLEIARGYPLRILSIRREEFSFGRSLNMGCEAGDGDFLVFLSAHCIPCREDWLEALLAPLAAGKVAYSYGRQLGGETSRFSEARHFEKFFPETSRIPQEGFFCNNANAALERSWWRKHPFDEELTGLEDMHLAKFLVEKGQSVGYVAEAPVYHCHEEPWSTVRRRYEREALALQRILPNVHLTFGDFLRYTLSAVLSDSGAALQERRFWSTLGEICLYRLMQYWGAYRGNRNHRELSRRQKDAYFFPRKR